MSDTFTASNGIQIETGEGRTKLWRGVGRRQMHDDLLHAFSHLSVADMVALRELFLYEAGVWVDPETDALCIRADGEDDHRGRAVAIILDGLVSVHREHSLGVVPDRQEVLARYFAAHPEPKPEWHDAKPGEVWLLNYDGDDVPAIAVADEGSPSFQFGDSAGDPSRVGTEHPDIVDARRIWPEVKP